MVAGNETTASTVAWVLYSLACNQAIQDTLRAEVLACKENKRPYMDTPAEMPYMDAVVRETLRLYPPVASIARGVERDSFIPTEMGWSDRNGSKRDGLQYVLSLISVDARQQKIHV